MVDNEFVRISMGSLYSRLSGTFFGILRYESDYDTPGFLHWISALAGLIDCMAFIRPPILQHIY
jgi:hypothetical protein